MEDKSNYSTIAEMNNGIILAKYESKKSNISSYQKEAELEEWLISNLELQGYERIHVSDDKELYDNLKIQLEKLNNVEFTDSEWNRFLLEYLNCPNDGLIEKTRKVQEDYIYDFRFDNGLLKNIKIIDKKDISNNNMQVVSQVRQGRNRYDVTILVNGLPLVHIELKSRGKRIYEAFNQIHRYMNETLNTKDSLYKYVQIFVISNGTYTKYFANTTAKDKSNYEFTIDWADAKNNVITDLEDFTKTFFEKRILLEVLTKYCVFDSNNNLIIMRPYQIAATERILWKITSSYQNRKYGTIDAGGYIWHTTGSGKTLTSFKTARLATSLDFIDKVFFVVDRKDLDYQTMKEYQRFQKDSVNGSKNTRELKKNIEKNDSRIVVTTIQKLNEFIKSNPKHEIYDKHCVLIFDECHRSQFGEAQRNIRKRFKKYYQFGFTGTPIFKENSTGIATTADVFGQRLHSYVITDAIRDGKVLKFKVDYNNLLYEYKKAEENAIEVESEDSRLLLHENRIEKIVEYILENYDKKTHRNENLNIKQKREKGFNAMFAVESIQMAKKYYNQFKKSQENIPEKERLRVFTIFSYAQNEEQDVVGNVEDESLDIDGLDKTSKQFIEHVIQDYDKTFETNFASDGIDFQNYYRDISRRVKNKDIDLLIVVGMFLTGFDAPTLNTLFVDKNLRYHGLIQAYSRTNRILSKVKPFGNIVCFRDLEKATDEAIRKFGDENSADIILEKSFKEYMDGYYDLNGNFKEGYIGICSKILVNFEDPTKIQTEEQKAQFVKIFGKLLTITNILKNFDEFEKVDKIISERQMQDYKSTYLKIKDEWQREEHEDHENNISYSDVEFYIDYLKTDDINLDYILRLILEKKQEGKESKDIEEEITRVASSSIETRSKKELLLKYIQNHDLEQFENVEDILESFYAYAKVEREKKIDEVVSENNLNEDKARYYIKRSLSKGYATDEGMDLDNCITGVSRLGGAREKKKNGFLKKVRKIVEEFVGI